MGVSGGSLRHCRITVEYDGTAYNGWQVQKNAPSIQAALEKAASHLAGCAIRVGGAGRTDAGVHARGQAARLALPSSLPVEKIPEAMNSRLPADIAVTAASLVPESFDPRRQCILKQYSYSLHFGPVRPALGNRRSWHIKRPLDVVAMREAVGLYAGTHDFTSFCNRELSGLDNVRTVERSVLEELEPDGAGRGRLLFRFEGRSFLYNQVRAMVGTVVDVGTGRFRADGVPEIFALRDRARAGQSAPPWGLCLEWVLYPGEGRPPDALGLF